MQQFHFARFCCMLSDVESGPHICTIASDSRFGVCVCFESGVRQTNSLFSVFVLSNPKENKRNEETKRHSGQIDPAGKAKTFHASVGLA